MKILTTNGLAVFGPGSEWFWAMLQFLVLVTTFFVVYRQLRAAVAANAFARKERLEDTWDARPLTQARLKAAIALRNSPDADVDAAMRALAKFFSDLFELHDRGHLAERDVMPAWGVNCQVWWHLLGPAVLRYREAESVKILYLGFEELAGFCRRKSAAWGIAPIDIDDVSRSAWLDKAIGRATENLERIADVESRTILEVPAIGPKTEAGKPA
jgi:hypothetical protein